MNINTDEMESMGVRVFCSVLLPSSIAITRKCERTQKHNEVWVTGTPFVRVIRMAAASGAEADPALSLPKV